MYLRKQTNNNEDIFMRKWNLIQLLTFILINSITIIAVP